MFPSADQHPLAVAAATLGLSYEQSKTATVGVVGLGPGRGVAREHHATGRFGEAFVKVLARGSGRRSYLFYGALFPPTGTGFRMLRRSWLRWLVPSAATTGDPGFDRRVVVFGPDAARIRSYLNPGRRQAVLALIALVPNARIRDGSIDGTIRASWLAPVGVDEIVATVEQFVETAQELID